jgi:hypothetical protein
MLVIGLDWEFFRIKKEKESNVKIIDENQVQSAFQQTLGD